jgi:protoheme IX farnesyltransferase
MNSTANPVSRPQLRVSCRAPARLPDFIELMKPRVMTLAVFTALVGLTIAPGHLGPLLGSVAILGIAVGAGAAGVLNMWYDADIDSLMARTARRPIPRGKISRTEALVFGLALAVSAVAILGCAVNHTAAALLAFAIFFYVVVYTAWLKRRTPQNIVVGGAAGALPPLIGWAAATGEIGLEPLVLFLIIFLWTPPHFWALSLNQSEDYSRAGVPMLPVVAGRAATIRQILFYTALLVPISMLPWVLGFAGTLYGAAAAVCGAVLIGLSLQLHGTGEADRQPAQRLFVFSIVYLFVLFAALLTGDGGNRWSPMPSMSTAPMLLTAQQRRGSRELIDTHPSTRLADRVAISIGELSRRGIVPRRPELPLLGWECNSRRMPKLVVAQPIRLSGRVLERQHASCRRLVLVNLGPGPAAIETLQVGPTARPGWTAIGSTTLSRDEV